MINCLLKSIPQEWKDSSIRMEKPKTEQNEKKGFYMVHFVGT